MSLVVCFHTAGVRVDLVGADEDVVELLRRVAAPTVVDSSAGPAVVTLDAGDIRVPPDAESELVAARLLHAVDTAALGATSTLPIHAAVLAGPAGCVVLPGPSGAGKSTLAGAALQRGLTLLSDEAACLTTPVGMVVPHPRPLKLSRRSRLLLGVSGASDPEGEVAVGGGSFGRTAAPASVHRCVGIVLPNRVPGREAVLRPVGRSAALAAILQHRLRADLRRWPHERAWAYLTELVNGVRVATLHFADPHEAANRLAELLGSVSGPGCSAC